MLKDGARLAILQSMPPKCLPAMLGRGKASSAHKIKRGGAFWGPGRSVRLVGCIGWANEEREKSSTGVI
jgi:hypothetical protein